MERECETWKKRKFRIKLNYTSLEKRKNLKVEEALKHSIFKLPNQIFNVAESVIIKF